MVPEMFKHMAASASCTVPVVVVLSEYVPLELPVHVPDTWSDPVTDADAQPTPRFVRSASPLTLRHDDITVQTPTTLPPHGVPPAHAPAAPPPEVPPVPPDPLLELPPVPDGPLETGVHAPESIPNAIAITRAADCTFIERAIVGRAPILLREVIAPMATRIL
jgi:hypothetical protein